MFHNRIIILFFISLIFLPIINTLAEKSDMIKLLPSDDAYVIVDINDPKDIQGRAKLNTGDLEFLKLWYAWNVTESQEKIATLVYLKFDLKGQNLGNVVSANLNMKPFVTFLSESPKLVSVVYVPDSNWNESEITYETRPSYPPQDITSTVISNIDEWYMWDITELVKQNSGSDLSIVLRFHNIIDKNEELITFYSTESKFKENAPYLEIKYSEQSSTEYMRYIVIGIILASAIVFVVLKYFPRAKILGS